LQLCLSLSLVLLLWMVMVIVKEQAKIRANIGMYFRLQALMICSGIWKSKTSFLALWWDILEKNWVAGVIEVVGLTERKDDQVKEYSSGMCRRFMIARSLIHN
jgi:ABC-type multidrug transport system ATPase subunit